MKKVLWLVLLFPALSYASLLSVTPQNTYICPVLAGNTAYAVYPESYTPPYQGETVNQAGTIQYAGITCDNASVNNLQSVMVGQPQTLYYLVYGSAPTNHWDSAGGDVYYGLFFWDGTDVVGGANIPTQFTSFTVSTTTGTVNAQGFWDATTTSGIYEQIQFFQFDNIFGQQSYQEFTATTTGAFNWTFSYLDPPTATGTTTANFASDTIFSAFIYQYDNAYFNDPFTGITDPRYKTLLVATSTTRSPSDLYYNLASTTALFAYPEYECGLTSMIGCIKNALIWAFYPTEDAIENYKTFLALIQSKPPIGYFTSITGSMGNLSATSSPEFSVTIPYSLRHYIFDPFDIGIASILWFFFIFNFYKRLKTITI